MLSLHGKQPFGLPIQIRPFNTWSTTLTSRSSFIAMIKHSRHTQLHTRQFHISTIRALPESLLKFSNARTLHSHLKLTHAWTTTFSQPGVLFINTQRHLGLSYWPIPFANKGPLPGTLHWATTSISNPTQLSTIISHTRPYSGC